MLPLFTHTHTHTHQASVFASVHQTKTRLKDGNKTAIFDQIRKDKGCRNSQSAEGARGDFNL